MAGRLLDDFPAARVLAQMRRLREAGATLAIDDLGAGHSNVAYLLTLPVSVLKIDQSFARGLAP